MTKGVINVHPKQTFLQIFKNWSKMFISQLEILYRSI